MSSPKKQERKTIENALFHALKAHGLISPVNKENEEAEEMGTESTVIALPAEFADPEKFIKPTTKTTKTVKMTPDHARSRTYAKVALKKTTKRKGK